GERTHPCGVGVRRGVHTGLDRADYRSFRMAAIVFLVSPLDLFGRGHWLATDEPAEHRRVSEHELAVIAGEKEERHAEKADLAWYGLLARSRNAYMLCASE